MSVDQFTPHCFCLALLAVDHLPAGGAISTTLQFQCHRTARHLISQPRTDRITLFSVSDQHHIQSVNQKHDRITLFSVSDQHHIQSVNQELIE